MAAGGELPGLGLKTDRPRLNTAVDLTRLKLTPTEGFILSRVDGFASYDEICRMSGLGRDETLALLRKLKDADLILVSSVSAVPSRNVERATLRSPSPSPEQPASVSPPVAVAREMPLDLHEQENRKADPSRANATSVLERLDDGHPVDPACLVEGTDLSLETKQRILRLHRRLRKLAPHELLGVDEHADRAVVRKAFASASKELHPDRYFGKDLGSFRDKLAQIFSCMSEAVQSMQKSQKHKR